MKERASQQLTRNWNGRVTDMPCSVSRVFMAAIEAGQAAPQRLYSMIFPFGLKAEFLAHQNRRPPPSSAQRFGPLVPRGCWPVPPDFL
jgi:hypothetical protein